MLYFGLQIRLLKREEPLASVVADGFDRDPVSCIDRLPRIIRKRPEASV
jgi:hypothetical protein